MHDKVAVITGAASGLGLAYAKALASAGASVVINDYDSTVGASARNAAASIDPSGAKVIGLDGDVRDVRAMGAVVAAAVERFGGLDIVIANAGIDRLGYVHEMTYETWRSVVDVHIDGTFNVIHHAVPHLIKRRGGTILTSGSAGAFAPIARHLPYAAAKAALFGMNQVLATELGPHGITVNSIWPGLSRTHIVDDYAADAMAAGLMDEVGAEQFKNSAQPPENVTPLMLYLCSDGARHITGRTFSIMHGQLSSVSPPGQDLLATAATPLWTYAEIVDALGRDASPTDAR